MIIDVKPVFCNNLKIRCHLTTILLVTLIILSGACSRKVYVPVLVEPVVNLGDNIETILVVDRTEPGRFDDQAGTDSFSRRRRLQREAARSSFDGLVKIIESSPGYNAIRVPESFSSPAVRPGEWPKPLSWKEIDDLAAGYEGDALLVLEVIDSEFVLTDGAILPAEDVDNESLLGGTAIGGILSRRAYAGGSVGVKVGYRVYDLVNRTVADEFMINHHVRWEAGGNALQMVIGGVIDHRNALMDASFQAGMIYGERISPYWQTLQRDFFTRGRGNSDFKTGVRRATVSDWDGAKDSWYRSSESGNRKTAGRSAYNLALIHEISGDLDLAIEWAQYAYSEYRLRRARKYVSLLEMRMTGY